MSVDSPVRRAAKPCCPMHGAPQPKVMNRAERRKWVKELRCKCHGECGWH